MDAAANPGLPARALRRVGRFARALLRFVGTLFTIGFSLLPLAALLAALPAVSPNEAVLTDTVPPARSWRRRTARRVLAVFAGLVVLIALFAFAIETVSRLPLPEKGQLGILAKKVLGFSVVDLIPDDADPNPAPAAQVIDDTTPTADEPTENPWLPPQDLIEKRDGLRKRRDRENLPPVERTKAVAELKEVEAQLADRATRSAKLRLLLDVSDWDEWRRQGRPDPKPQPRGAINPAFGTYLVQPLWKVLPPALVEHWPFVFLIMYATDLVLLLMIGRIPLAYNARYLWVRKRDTLLTALAFTVVVALVVVLLAFVNGMYKLNEGTGVPGNVLVLGEGSTDELFSNLAYTDVQNVVQETTAFDQRDYPIKPVGVARAVRGPDGKLVPLPPEAARNTPGAEYLASWETYLVMNQAVPVKEGEKPRRRFLQVRAMLNIDLSAAVHAMELQPGGRWFPADGIHQGPGPKVIPCAIGEGAAATLGPDVGKAKLGVGDTFELGDRTWLVVGVMKTGGTTFGSEIWCSVSNNPVLQDAGKANKFSTLVVRASDGTDAGAKALAFHIQNRYQGGDKLKAFAEPEYYKELTKTNEQFLNWIVFLAVVMAVGGVFGVMNTMFASIAARIKEVGVLRILGFKRWQILISFMLESLAIAFVGGLLGCLLGSFANFFEASSRLSSGGGHKDVALKLVVDYQTIAAGMLFTLVMGRLGGLVPALSAMRMEILDSLR